MYNVLGQGSALHSQHFKMILRDWFRIWSATLLMLLQLSYVASAIDSKGGRIVVTNVLEQSAEMIPLLDTILVKRGAVATSSEIDRVSGISTDGEKLFTVSMGNDKKFRIMTLELQGNSTLDVTKTEILLDDEQEIEDIRPTGLLWAGEKFWISHDDETISIYDIAGTKSSVVKTESMSFERKGDGLHSLTSEPDGGSFWKASLVGQIKDGAQHVRLMRFDVTAESSHPETIAQFAYILESSGDRIDEGPNQPTGRPSPTPSPMSSQSPSFIPSDAPSLAPTIPWDDGSLNVLPAESVERSRSRPLPRGHHSFESYIEADTPIPRNGLVSLIALDSFGDFLALERVQSRIVPEASTRHFEIQLFYVETAGALDITDIELMGVVNIEEISVKKTLLVDFNDLDLGSDSVPNFESMTLFSSHDENTLTLMLASNNEYEINTDTYVMMLNLEYTRDGVVLAKSETKGFLRENISNTTELHGKAQNAMVWVHPHDPAESLLLAAHGVGVAIFDLKGEEVFDVENKILLTNSWYRDLDIIYAFPLSTDRLVDLVVLANARTDVLEFQLINPFAARQGKLADVTAQRYTLDAADLVEAYTSPFTGIYYVFVADIRGKNQITQLQLNANTMGRVEITFVRSLSMPPGEISAMTVDKNVGTLYVAMNGSEDVAGIYKFDAEPSPHDNHNSDGTALSSMMFHFSKIGLEPPFADLTIYYAGDKEGYILASHPSDSSLAIFDREGVNNDYIGSFHVGTSQLGNLIRSERISAMNVNLGKEFPCGMLVVQDLLNTEHRNVNVQDSSVYNVQTNFQMIPFEDINIATGISTALPLPVDTQSWHPRRLALVTLVDKIAEEVHVQMAQGLLAVRTAQELLEHLGAASYELYRPGSAMRHMMNNNYIAPVDGSGGRRRRRLVQEQQQQQKEKTTIEWLLPNNNNNNNNNAAAGDETQRHLRGQGRTTTTTYTSSNIFQNTYLPRCAADSSQMGDAQEQYYHGGSYARARAELKAFVWKVSSLAADSSSLMVVGDDELNVKDWIDRIQSIVWSMPEDVNLE